MSGIENRRRGGIMYGVMRMSHLQLKKKGRAAAIEGRQKVLEGVMKK